MGRKSRDKLNRRINSQKSADSKSKTTAPSTSNSKELKMDGENVTKSSSDEIQGASNFPRIVTEETDDKESTNKSYEDIKPKGQSLSIKEKKKLDDEVEKLKYIVNESTKRTFENFFMPEDKKWLYFVTDKLREFDDYLMSEHPNIFTSIVENIDWIEEELNIQNYPNVKRLLNCLPRSEVFLILNTIEDDLEDRDKAKTLTIYKGIDDDNEITTYLDKVKGQKVGIDDSSDIQKLAIEGKVEEDKKGICDNIQESVDYVRNMGLEFGDEVVKKILDAIDENTGKEKVGCGTKNPKKNLNECPRQKIIQEISLLDFHRDLRKQLRSLRSKSKANRERLRMCKSNLESLRRMKNRYFLNQEVYDPRNRKTNETEAKEKVNPKNDRESKIVEGYKKEKKFEGFTDCIEIPDQNANEGKNEDKICKDCPERRIDDIQNFHSSKERRDLAQESEDYERYIEKETTNRKLSKKLEIRKLEKEATNKTDMNVKQILSEEIRDNSSEKEPLIAFENTESGEAKNNEDHRKDEVPTADESDELDDKPAEVVKDLDKNDNIHFRFESNNNKHIFAGNPNDYYTLNDNQDISFNYKDENVQICFTGNHVFISTEDSEFKIFIRKSDPVNLADKAAQTSTLQ